MAAACSTIGTDSLGPGVVADRIEETYALFARLWQPWGPADQPLSGEHGR